MSRVLSYIGMVLLTLALFCWGENVQLVMFSVLLIELPIIMAPAPATEPPRTDLREVYPYPRS